MSAFSVNPVSFIRNAMASAPEEFCYYESGRLTCKYLLEKTNQSAARGLKKAVTAILAPYADCKPLKELNFIIEIDARSKKISETTLRILQKTLRLIPICTRYHLISHSMKDEDVASLLLSLNCSPQHLGLHYHSSEMGILPMMALSELLLREEGSLSRLSLNVKLISHQAFFHLTGALAKASSLNVFEIKNIEFQEAQLDILKQALVKNSSISTLVLNDCEIPAESESFLQEVLKSNSRMQNLVLENSTTSCLRALGKALVDEHHLTELHVKGSKRRVEEESEIQSFIANLPLATSLQALTLQDVGLNQIEIRFLCEWLEKNTTLEDLDLSQSSFDAINPNSIADEQINHFIDMLRKNLGLKRLDLSRCEIDTNAMINFFSCLEFNHSLEDLVGLTDTPRNEEFLTQLKPILLKLIHSNETFTLPSLDMYGLDHNLTGDPLTRVDENVEIALVLWILKNRNNQKMKKVSLVELMLNAVASHEKSQFSSSSHSW